MYAAPVGLYQYVCPIPQAMPGAELCQPFRLQCRSSLNLCIIINHPCAEQELHTSQEIRKAEGIIEFIRVHQPNQRIAKQSAFY